jgi:hypothetical protein
MSVRALPAELAAVRALVADGLAEIGDAGDTGQVWIRSATARLTALDGVLTEAAGVLAAPVQVIAVTVATFLVVAGSAAVSGALGLGSGGVLAVSGAALLITFMAGPRVSRHVYTLVGRRRLALAAARMSPSPGRTAPSDAAPARNAETGPAGAAETGLAGVAGPGLAGAAGPGLAGAAGPGLAGAAGTGLAGVAGTGLAGVPDRLLRARVRLVSAALRHVGAGSWSTPELRRAIRTDPVVRRLAEADQLLCQAVDCVERHLGDLRKDTL